MEVAARSEKDKATTLPVLQRYSLEAVFIEHRTTNE